MLVGLFWRIKVTTIKNVVFDFGGVLLDWNPRYFYSSVFNDDEKMEYFIKNIVTSTWNSQMDRGRTFEECMKELSEEHPEYKDQINLYRKGWETFPYAFNTYKFLQSFEGIVVSGEEKMIKPEKGIYLTLLERYNLKPEETFFMDDNIKNVEVAKTRGIHAVQFTGTDENLAEISKILKIKI